MAAALLISVHWPLFLTLPAEFGMLAKCEEGNIVSPRAVAHCELLHIVSAQMLVHMHAQIQMLLPPCLWISPLWVTLAKMYDTSGHIMSDKVHTNRAWAWQQQLCFMPDTVG